MMCFLKLIEQTANPSVHRKRVKSFGSTKQRSADFRLVVPAENSQPSEQNLYLFSFMTRAKIALFRI